MKNEFKVGDLVSAREERLWGPSPSVEFILEFRTHDALLSDIEVEQDQAKVMWVNGQHYWCPCYMLKLKQTKGNCK